VVSAEEPGPGKREEGDAPGARAAQPGEERERERRQHVLRGEGEVRDPVVKGSEAGVDEVRVRGSRQSQRRPGCGERSLNDTASHASACHRKNAPAMATRAPAARSATRPQLQRWMTPIPMPVACSMPVAITKPML